MIRINLLKTELQEIRLKTGVNNHKIGVSKMLIEYVKNKRKERVGCLVAEKVIFSDCDTKGDFVADFVAVGWSKYNSKVEKISFNKKIALRIAVDRMKKLITNYDDRSHKRSKKDINLNCPCCPFTIQDKWIDFQKRCVKYFRVPQEQIFIMDISKFKIKEQSTIFERLFGR